MLSISAVMASLLVTSPLGRASVMFLIGAGSVCNACGLFRGPGGRGANQVMDMLLILLFLLLLLLLSDLCYCITESSATFCTVAIVTAVLT